MDLALTAHPTSVAGELVFVQPYFELQGRGSLLGCNPSGWVIVPSDGAMPSLDQEVGLDMGLPPAGERFAGIATLPLRFVAWSEAVQSAAGTS